MERREARNPNYLHYSRAGSPHPPHSIHLPVLKVSSVLLQVIKTKKTPSTSRSDPLHCVLSQCVASVTIFCIFQPSMQNALAEEATTRSAHEWNREAEHDGHGWNAPGIIFRPGRAPAHQHRINPAPLMAGQAAGLFFTCDSCSLWSQDDIIVL